MTRMIQIRNVPEDLHRLLKSRAALCGQSLSDYLLDELKRVAQRPTLHELADRIGSRSRITPPVRPAEAVRIERDSR